MPLRYYAFAFSWRKTIISAVIIAALIFLGCWQLDRMAWKEGLLADIAHKQEETSVLKFPNGTDYVSLDYRRAELTGLVDDNKMVFLGPRTYNGEVGYHMLTPMYLSDGKVILVNQGFVPQEWPTKPHTRSNVQMLTGTLRLPALPGRFTPLNPPEGDKFYWADLLAIGNRLGTPHLLPLVFELDRLGNQYPIGGQTNLIPANNHFQYALTWFALALIMLVVYIVSSVKRTRIDDYFKPDKPKSKSKPEPDTHTLWS